MFGIHPIHSNHDLEATKDANENICQLTDDRKNHMNRNDSIEDNNQNQINSEDKSDDKCEQIIDNELTKESGHQNQCTPIHQTNDDSTHHNTIASQSTTLLEVIPLTKAIAQTKTHPQCLRLLISVMERIPDVVILAEEVEATPVFPINDLFVKFYIISKFLKMFYYFSINTNYNNLWPNYLP